MKSAVFALLFSSVFAQPKQGTPEWDMSMDMAKKDLNMMAEKGFNMIVNLDPKACTRSKQCGMPQRFGGCCFRVSVSRDQNGEMQDYQNDILKMQGEDGGLCYQGSGVDVVEMNGGRVDSYTYSEYMWDNDPMVRTTWGAYMEGSTGNESFEDFNNWLKEVMPDQIARRDQFVEGQCIDEKLHPLDTTLNCNSNTDCNDAWGHFNGGCCARIEQTRGPSEANFDDMLKHQGDGGYCTTQAQADFVNGRDEVNMMEYARHDFETNHVAKQTWLMHMGDMSNKDVSWDQAVDAIRQGYPEIDQQNDMYFKGSCMSAERVPGEPVDFEAIERQYFGDEHMDGDRDHGMDEDRMSFGGIEISMSEEDGKTRIIIEMGAINLAASALALAAMTLY